MILAAAPDYSFSYSYDPTRRQLLVRWHAPSTDAALYAQYAELMALAEAEGNCRFWLLDVRDRNVSSSAFGRWFGSDFAPLAHAAFGRPLFLAYVVGPQHQDEVLGLGGQAMQHSCAAHDVYPFYFDSLAAAQEWLAHQQAHDEETRRAAPTRSAGFSAAADRSPAG